MLNTLSCPIPANLTPLSPNGFNFSISKLPEVSFFCQQVQLPGISIGSPQQVNPFVNVPVPGEILTYDQLEIQFLVDVQMANYKSIYNWLVALGFPDNYEQYKAYIDSDTTKYTELAKNYSDGTLQILTGTNNVAAIVSFQDMFPISIGSLMFQATNTDVQYLVGSASFRYTSYKFL
jgi:hypothetical protein